MSARFFPRILERRWRFIHPRQRTISRLKLVDRLIKVELKPIRRNNLPKIYDWRRDPRIIPNLNSRPLKNYGDHLLWFKSLNERSDEKHFGIWLEEMFLGVVWLANINQRDAKAEVRIYMGVQKGDLRGAGRAALGQLCRQLKNQGKLKKLYAYVWIKNKKAGRCFQNAGFKKEGILLKDRWWESTRRRETVLFLGKHL